MHQTPFVVLLPHYILYSPIWMSTCEVWDNIWIFNDVFQFDLFLEAIRVWIFQNREKEMSFPPWGCFASLFAVIVSSFPWAMYPSSILEWCAHTHTHTRTLASFFNLSPLSFLIFLAQAILISTLISGGNWNPPRGYSKVCHFSNCIDFFYMWTEESVVS